MALKPPEKQTVLERYVPIVNWLPRYRWGEWLRLDLLAALTVWALLVPEAMAYSGIAGVSPEVGLVVLRKSAGSVGSHALAFEPQSTSIGPPFKGDWRVLEPGG
jgi:MFS superfamily sulfate permease-like transporter